MDAYTSFAQVYDELMDNIPYDEWISYITSLLHEYNITKGLVAELGCGTGTITEGLAAAGYDMIGIDVSSDMLEIANEKRLRMVSHPLCISSRICVPLNYMEQ